jgi:hypothetical protein
MLRVAGVEIETVDGYSSSNSSSNSISSNSRRSPSVSEDNSEAIVDVE